MLYPFSLFVVVGLLEPLGGVVGFAPELAAGLIDLRFGLAIELLGAVFDFLAGLLGFLLYFLARRTGLFFGTFLIGLSAT